MSLSTWTLLALALVILIGLSAYAGWLHFRLYRQRQARRSEAEAYQRQKSEHEAWLIESIRIIARQMVEDDLNLSEGAIRLHHLLNGLGLPRREREQFQAIDSLYYSVREFDTHEARRALSPQERQRQDTARETRERTHREAVLTLADRLCHYQFQAVGWEAGAESTPVASR